MRTAQRSAIARGDHVQVCLLTVVVAAVLVAQAVPVSEASGLFGFEGVNANTLSTASLAAPTGVLVTDAQQTTLELQWNASASSFVTGYQVYRSEGSGGPYAPVGGPLGAGTLSIIDGGLTPETTYAYVVRALGAGWESVDSMEALGTTLP